MGKGELQGGLECEGAGELQGNLEYEDVCRRGGGASWWVRVCGCVCG